MDSIRTHAFPPYGLMPLEFIDPPTDMKQPSMWNGGFDYGRWINAASTLIGDRLWPLYDAAGGVWTGKAIETMGDVTLADFALFEALRPKLLEQAGNGVRHTQRELFEIEDVADVKSSGDVILADRSLDATLRIYLAAAAVNHEPSAAQYIRRMAQHAGQLPLHLKYRIQRPRAYQVAFIMGKNFTYNLAASAASPAMISGHCFQGVIGGIATYDELVRSGTAQPTLAAIAPPLAQHSVDIGDRRVFAGVHYPSDNLSSWITMFLAAPFIFSKRDGVCWAWKAITERSAVYLAMRKGIENGSASALSGAWDWLHELAGYDAKEIHRHLEDAITRPC